LGETISEKPVLLRHQHLNPHAIVRIMREMYRAEVEPMQKDDRIPRSGLWKVVIYEGRRSTVCED
jgi:hypothetical protein